VSEDDRGGFIDLGYALVVMFFAFAPLVVGMIVAAVVGVTVGNSVASWLFLAAAMLPLLGWAYFYFPMGATVAAIEYSVNPLRVLHWCTVCFWDYVKLLLLFVPFFVIVTAVSYLTGAFLVGVLPAVSFVPKELFLLFNTFIVSNFFNQYIFVVGYTALGLIARMHESELGWRSN
jgi:hypothetical protein